MNNTPLANTKHYFLKNSFFSSTITEWNNFDSSLRTLTVSENLKKRLLYPCPNFICNYHYPKLSSSKISIISLSDNKFWKPLFSDKIYRKVIINLADNERFNFK